MLRLCTTSSHGKRKYSPKLSLRQDVTPNVRMKTIFHFEINSQCQNRVHAGDCGRNVYATVAISHVRDASDHAGWPDG